MERVSIIITTCRGTDKLQRAVDSALNQTYNDIEVIVVDDNGAGTEEQKKTACMMEKYRYVRNVKYIVHDFNRNGAVARNTGAKNATGIFYAFLDDDDFFLPRRTEMLIAGCKKHNCESAYSSVLFVRGQEPESGLHALEKGFSRDDLLITQSLLGTGSNIFISKKVFDSINGFDESFKRYQDVEFMIRILERTSICGVDEFLVCKDITSMRFYPVYSSFIIAQDHFLNIFQNRINQLNNMDKRKCLLTKRLELVYSAYISKDKKNISEATKCLSNDVPDLSLKEKAAYKTRGFYLNHLYGLLNPLREKRHVRKAEIFKKSLDISVLNQVYKALGDNR